MAELTVEHQHLRFLRPLLTAYGEAAEREILRVRLAFSDDDFGEGEAAPLEEYDGVSLAAVRAALDAYAELLAGVDPETPHKHLLSICAAERDLPEALAAIDLALWDRSGRRTGLPVAKLLAAGAAESVAVNAVIGAEDRAGAAEAAAAAVEAGFECVKVKVGVGDDGGRLAAVRAAVGDAVALRADANGAWKTPDEALANLRALAPAGIELCEEPIHGIEPMRAVRARALVPIAMDETAAQPGAPGSGAADAVCLKVARGGITRVLQDARDARQAGTKVYVASTFDGPLGIAAAVHAAAGLRASGPVAYCGLATLGFFEGFEGVLEPARGRIAVPAGPGLLGG